MEQLRNDKQMTIKLGKKNHLYHTILIVLCLLVLFLFFVKIIISPMIAEIEQGHTDDLSNILDLTHFQVDDTTVEYKIILLIVLLDKLFWLGLFCLGLFAVVYAKMLHEITDFLAAKRKLSLADSLIRISRLENYPADSKIYKRILKEVLNLSFALLTCLLNFIVLVGAEEYIGLFHLPSSLVYLTVIVFWLLNYATIYYMRGFTSNSESNKMLIYVLAIQITTALLAYYNVLTMPAPYQFLNDTLREMGQTFWSLVSQWTISLLVVDLVLKKFNMTIFKKRKELFDSMRLFAIIAELCDDDAVFSMVTSLKENISPLLLDCIINNQEYPLHVDWKSSAYLNHSNEIQRLKEYLRALEDLEKTSGQNLMRIIDKEKSLKKADSHEVYELFKFILLNLKHVLDYLEKRDGQKKAILLTKQVTNPLYNPIS